MSRRDFWGIVSSVFGLLVLFAACLFIIIYGIIL